MSRFSVDYSKLSNSVNVIDKKVIRLSDVKHRLEKVAFDVFRMKDGDPDELWQIQNSDDGDYIVAKYDMEDADTKVKTSAAWDVLVSNGSSDINVFYKDHPITKIANVADVDSVKRFLPSKLASDKGFVAALLNTLDPATKASILKLYPELV